MIIENGLIFTEENIFKKGNIEIENGRIKGIVFDDSASSNISPNTTDYAGNATDSTIANTNVNTNANSTPEHFDATDCYVIPGLIDLHLHGAMGCDLCDASVSSIEAIAKYELSQGVTTICPATMSLPLKDIKAIINSVEKYNTKPVADAANVVGINMEGPFINPDKCGAQNKDYICPPDLSNLEQLFNESNKLIKIIDIAPETEGAKELIDKYKDNVRISLAHSCADYDAARNAFESGVCQVTHLGNAMEPMTSRMPGPIVAAMENESVMVELIADGIHIHPAMVRMFYKLFGDDRIILISDSMEACGLDDGEYQLGGQKVTVKGKLAYLSKSANPSNDSSSITDLTSMLATSPKAPVIAGSVSSLMDCFKTAVLQMNIPIESAIKCATVNPAKALGIFNETGSLSVGKQADILVLNKSLEILKIFKR